MITILHLPTGQVGIIPNSSYIPTTTISLYGYINFICNITPCKTFKCELCPWSTLTLPKPIEQFDIMYTKD